jgi:hypothetical protein
VKVAVRSWPVETVSFEPLEPTSCCSHQPCVELLTVYSGVQFVHPSLVARSLGFIGGACDGTRPWIWLPSITSSAIRRSIRGPPKYDRNCP